MSSHESKIEDVRKEVHAQSEQSEIQLLQEKYDKLEQSFNESSSKLFESLREDDQVTDTKLQKDFESLCLAVDTWIEGIIGLEPKYFRKQWKEAMHKESGYLTTLGLPEKLFVDSVIRPMDTAEWLSRRANCERLVVTLLVWRFIERYIFAERWPIGISQRKKKVGGRARSSNHERTALMDEVFEVMTGEAKGNEVNPFSNSNVWRSDTVKAMTRIPGFERRRDREADVLFSLLEDDLKIWVKSGSLGTQKPRPEFFDLAITLHTSIVCSRRIYKVWRTGPTEWAFPHQSPRPWQMKDVDTWRLPIRPQKQPVLVCNLSLGLQTQRNVDSRSEPLTLVKPTVLVCEVEEAYGEHDRSRSPRSSSTSRRAGQDSYAVSPKGQGILSNMFSGQSRVTSQTPVRSSEKERKSNSHHQESYASRPRQSRGGWSRSKPADDGREYGSSRSQSYFPLGSSHYSPSGTSHTTSTAGSESQSDSEGGESPSDDDGFDAGEASQAPTPNEHCGQRTSRRGSKGLPAVQEQANYTVRVQSPLALARTYSQK